MAFCEKCGAPLDPGTAFCTKCGARKAAPAGEEKRFCTRCGATLEPGKRFCGACGAPVEQPPIPVSPPLPAETPGPAASAPSDVSRAVRPPGPVPAASAPAVPSAVLPPPPSKKSPLAKILVAVLGVFALILAGVIGTCVYVGYRVKKKAEQVEQAYKKATMEKTPGAGGQGQSGNPPEIAKILGALGQATGQGKAGGSHDLSKILGAPGHGPAEGSSGGKVETRPAGTCSSGDQTAFDGYVKGAASASVPLEAGMTLTDIWSPSAGQPDLEILTTVDEIKPNTIHVLGKRLVGNDSSSVRDLCISDLLAAREYETGFGSSTPYTIPGATMFSMSQSVFADLKAGRPAALTYYSAFNNSGGGYDLRYLSKGTLARAEANDVPYSIIVNGDHKDLPTLHVQGDLGGKTWELWVLDDSANPLVLNLKVHNSAFHITYVKITYPEKKQVEQQLAQTGRAEIYGIYFDFNSATPRPESGPVLKEIAQVLQDNPAWKLEIDGHTDNIGGDAYNLKLSQQRAEGIRQSLITQYGIAADRLTSQGYGASRPKATNDTVEGRALNRRVELLRQ